MNYFEHHIGDYAQATAHLTFVEDAAYHRLLRKMYADEKPLPVDVKATQRLVGARTRDEKQAVADVLKEFFELREDGWHQARADREIAEFRSGEPEREVKKSNEANRLKAHREERSRLFERLTQAGLHAHWNVAIGELRALVAKLPETLPEMPAATAPETKPATAPATPATATQTPDPVPIPKPRERAETRGTRLPSDWALPEPWAEWARSERPDLNPETVAAKFVDHWRSQPGSAGLKLDWLATWRNWIRDERAPRPLNGAHAPQYDDWFKSDAGVDRKARELGMQARPSESYSSLRERVFQRLKEPVHAA